MNGDSAHIVLICNVAPKRIGIELARRIVVVGGHRIFRVI